MNAAIPSTAPPAPGPRDLRLTDAWDALSAPSISVFSTDVFDTLLWRTVTEPVDAFPLVAERLRARGQLSSALSPEAFGTIRQAAERAARRARALRLDQTEVTLDEIYAFIPAWVFGKEPVTTAPAEAEVDVEVDILVPDLDIVELLAAAWASGKRIVAISDTYFSAARLRRLLAQPVVGRLQFDEIFTSSDHRRNKSGGLYDIALIKLGVDGSAVLHLGDNPEADGHYPGLASIQTVAFERRPPALAHIDALETRLRPERRRDPATASGLASARAKVQFRTEVAELPASLEPHWRYGATVLGPIFAGFADWILDECEREEATKVGCLMREGEFLTDLVSRAARYRGSTVQAESLWINRAVCLRATTVQVDREALAPLLAGRTPPSVESLLRRLGVPLSALPSWTSHAQTTLDDPVVRHNLIEALQADDGVRLSILAGARTLRERIGRLVERTFGDGPVMLVDLGWGATIQGLLAQILGALGTPSGSVGLYLLTHEGSADQIVRTGIEARGFLGDVGFPESSSELIMRSPEILEQVCMPASGTQLDLDADLLPVCDANPLPGLQRTEADAVRKGIFAFQREWARYHGAVPGRLARLGRAKDELRPMLLRSVLAPTSEEATVFGAWQHDENRGTDKTDPIVDPADLDRVRHMGADQARRLPMQELYWPFGLAARVDEHWAQLMTAAAAGHIDWGALSSPLDTGEFAVVPRGVGVAEDATLRLTPRRNRLGLSSVTGTIRGSHIQELLFRPASTPGVIRLDRIVLRCWRQGEAQPIEHALVSPADFAGLEHANCFLVQPNVIIAHGSSAELRLALASVTPRIVYRVDLEVAFAAMQTSDLLVGEGRFGNLEEAAERLARADREIADMRGSVSWRATKPLRTAKRLLS